jgi:hypothetical protein
MKDKKQIQSYINNFRRHLTPFLRPGIGVTVEVHPARQQGAILEIKLGPEVENDDEYLPDEDTVNAAIKNIKQNLVGGNIDAIRFGGTNISMEPDRIVLIKGEDQPTLWSNESAKHDVEQIVQPLQRSES